MADFRLASRAKAQLIDIYDWTEERFGDYQAEGYYHGFRQTFRLLADFPGIGLPADEMRQGLRRFRYQSHYIFFTQEADHIMIRAIYHTAQKLRPQLFR